jgi:hypothetical protein
MVTWVGVRVGSLAKERDGRSRERHRITTQQDKKIDE